MASNNNGFADALKRLKTVAKVDGKVSMQALEDAANYFVKKMRPRIPEGYTGDLRDSLTVKVHSDHVSVVFGDEGWYWYLVEHGHRTGKTRRRIKGKHFVRNTVDAESKRIEEIMTEKIIKKME